MRSMSKGSARSEDNSSSMEHSVKNYDIVALGELLIDFTEAGRSGDGMKLFEQNPGGAPANMLTAAGHMGCRTAFIGKVGSDMHGRFLIETLHAEGIDTSGIIEDKDFFTTLAFVGLDGNGERSFSFARSPGADTMLRTEELDKSLLTSCRVLHVGSLSLTDEPSRSATFEAVRIARGSGAVISCDPNYRASLWKSREDAVDKMRSLIPMADIVKVSDEESLLITGCDLYEDAADAILAMGPKLVAVTLGSRGALIARDDHKEIIDAFKVDCVDTTGAGDSFWGGFVGRFLSFGCAVEDMTRDAIIDCAVTGNAFAALCVKGRGGIPSIPSYDEARALAASYKF